MEESEEEKREGREEGQVVEVYGGSVVCGCGAASVMVPVMMVPEWLCPVQWCMQQWSSHF